MATIYRMRAYRGWMCFRYLLEFISGKMLYRIKIEYGIIKLKKTTTAPRVSLRLPWCHVWWIKAFCLLLSPIGSCLSSSLVSCLRVRSMHNQDVYEFTISRLTQNINSINVVENDTGLHRHKQMIRYQILMHQFIFSKRLTPLVCL